MSFQNGAGESLKPGEGFCGNGEGKNRIKLTIEDSNFNTERTLQPLTNGKCA